MFDFCTAKRKPNGEYLRIIGFGEHNSVVLVPWGRPQFESSRIGISRFS